MVNKLKRLPLLFREVLKAASIEAADLGIKIYLVGGAARDLILGKTIFDLDIVAEGDAAVLAEKLARRFSRNFCRHHAFGTAAIYFDKHKIDFAMARKEHYPHWGALPKVKPAALPEDLFRRDFTINAMAIGLNKSDYGELIDFYHGAQDLKKGVIRVLHDKSFLEDPTRILRAVRFGQRFSFKLDGRTAGLMEEALKLDALTFVHAHRLSDEFILILKEPWAFRYIEKLYQLTGFSFFDKKVELTKRDFDFLRRIETTAGRYRQIIKSSKTIDIWLMYLGGILINLPAEEIVEFFRKFSLKKIDMIRVLSMKENLIKVKRLNKKVMPHSIYHLLNPLSIESILFFYAYYPQSRIRANIRRYLRELKDIRLKVKGEDLKKMDMKPYELYSRLLQRLLYAKIDKSFSAKKEEISAAKVIFRRMIKSR